MALFIPTYFSPISQFTAIVNTDKIIFEVEDNYQKQSYRNRCYIYGANGKQLLNIPIHHPKTNGRKKTKDILVDNSTFWQKQHLKSLESAYKSSPFFEFYIDDLLPVFTKKYHYLLDINIDTFTLISKALQINSTYKKTSIYNVNTTKKDVRYLADIKFKRKEKTLPYTQVFSNKHGFIHNLSILDLLFMEGTNAINFLEKKRATISN